MKNKISISIVLALVIAFSCKQDDPVKTTKSTPTKVPDEVLAKLRDAGYSTQGLWPFQNGYIVEKDIFMTVDEIMALKPLGDNGRTNQYHTTNMVSYNRLVTVYVSSSLPVYVRDAVDEACSRYNALQMGLAFKQVTSSSGASITLQPVLWQVTYDQFGQPIYPPYASSVFPSSGNPGNTVYINTYWYGSTETTFNIPTVVTHEIGHCIGFRHTDWGDRTFSCGGLGPVSEGSSPDGAIHIPGTPTDAEADSWMLACMGINENRPFTAYDQIALKTVYPVLPEELAIQSDGKFYAVDATTGIKGFEWEPTVSGTQAATSASGYVYFIQNNVLWRYNSATHSVATFGTDTWANTAAMAYVNGYVYVIQNNVLWKVNLSTGTSAVFGTDTWANTAAMAGSGSYLYVIQNNVLWRVNLSNGTSAVFGTDTWANTAAMTVVGSYLYVVQNNVMWKVNLSNGSSARFGLTDTWANTAGMTAVGNFLYLVQNNALWKIDLSTSQSSVVGTDTWPNTKGVTAPM